jgi:hypothetical protein
MPPRGLDRMLMLGRSRFPFTCCQSLTSCVRIAVLGSGAVKALIVVVAVGCSLVLVIACLKTLRR